MRHCPVRAVVVLSLEENYNLLLIRGEIYGR
jgi:hypothetical protein